MTAKEQVLKNYPDAVCKRGLHPFFGWEYRIHLNDKLITASTATGAWVKAADRLKEGK
jgi:hypothetical protein